MESERRLVRLAEPGAGHVTMTVTAIDRILDDLLDLAGRG
jgi:hypothetical protein